MTWKALSTSRVPVNTSGLIVIAAVAVVVAQTAYICLRDQPFRMCSSPACMPCSQPELLHNTSSSNNAATVITSNHSAAVGISTPCYDSPAQNGFNGALRVQPDRDNPLWDFFENYKTGPVVHKWTQYFDVYHRYFSKYVGKEVHFLEIGVQSGGSIEMWKAYFGPGLHYYGVDINPYTKPLFESQGPPSVRVFVGSQSDHAFWKTQVLPNVPRLDIVLDDGGHSMDQQITTFEEVYGHVKQTGVYMVEDCATSYEPGYNGGVGRSGTWIEYSKVLVDVALHADYYNNGAERTQTTGSTMSIGYYDQMVVFEKGSHTKAPTPPKRGSMSMSYMPPTKNGGIDPALLSSLQQQYNKTNAIQRHRV